MFYVFMLPLLLNSIAPALARYKVLEAFIESPTKNTSHSIKFNNECDAFDNYIPITNKVPSLKFLAAHTLAKYFKPEGIKASRLPNELKEYALIFNGCDKPLSNNLTQNLLARAAQSDQFKNLYDDLVVINPRLDINISDAFGTPLHHAAKSQNVSIMYYLIEQGADVIKINNELASPLITFLKNLSIPAQDLHYEMADLLIKKGVSVNGIDKEKRTALMYAAQKGNAAIVKLLLRNGAHINAQDDYLYTAQTFAGMHQHSDILEILGKWGGNIHKACERISLLHHAVEMNNLGLATTLLELGSDSKVRNTKKLTALEKAFYENKFPMGQLLINFGAQANGELLVKSVNNVPWLTLLLQNDAPVNDSIYNGITPFAQAVMSKNFDAIKMLKAAGANIDSEANYKVSEDCTQRLSALHFAISIEDEQLFNFLVSLGCNIEKNHYFHGHPLQFAIENNKIKFIDLLLQAGVNPEAQKISYTNLNALEVALSSPDVNLDIIYKLMPLVKSINTVRDSYNTRAIIKKIFDFQCKITIKMLFDKGLYKALQKNEPEWKQQLVGYYANGSDIKKFLYSYRPPEYFQMPWYKKILYRTKEFIQNNKKMAIWAAYRGALVFSISAILFGPKKIISYFPYYKKA